MDPHDNDIVLRAVVPGNNTGIYYVLVSNLAMGTTPEDLRFLSKQVCSVERCFVYPNGSEGWVRVRGHAHFMNLFNHLNGRPLKDSMIVASSVNETNAISVYDRRKCIPKSDHSQILPPAGPNTMYAPNNWAAGYAGFAGQDNAPAVPMANCYYGNDGQVYTDPAAAAYYAGGFASGAGVAPGGSGYPQQYFNTGETSAAAASANLKIVVKNLSRFAGRNDIQKHLLDTIGGRKKLQEDIRLPRTPKGKNRQHALLLFKNREDAVQAISKLDKTEFMGLTLEAHFTTEAVFPHPPLSGDETEEMEMPGAAAAAFGTATQAPAIASQESQASQAPVVVDGSSSGNIDKGKTVQKYTSPLVVDGSMGYAERSKARQYKAPLVVDGSMGYAERSKAKRNESSSKK
ncbi:Nucleotide-binding, alpha-beta plait [Niveomyces insectorum RCEF 264]|uniref:Nucleotide-binding, alpha-beta plait n=1 Tax=Niveomyces insectorum RCEF 264 TaxID=1081102 RepID=A0A167ZZ04_9HYPO|nr:Nucleotide-binding, alpha-beta plait [Niveomyces insectorum RCEF 264]